MQIKKRPARAFQAGGCSTYVMSFSSPNSYPILLRILTRCFFFSLIVFLLGIAARDKDKTTTINGTVVDEVTGEPIYSANVEIGIRQESK